MKFLTNFLGLITAFSATISPINTATNTSTSILKDENNLPIDPIEIPQDNLKPVFKSDFNTKEELYKYYDEEAKKIVSSMKRDYEVLKKILKKNDDNLPKLPFEDFSKSTGVFSQKDFLKESENKYNFFALNYYWDQFFNGPLIYGTNKRSKGWKAFNFDYTDYLNNQITRMHIKTDADAKNSIKVNNEVYYNFDGKADDQLFLKVVVIDFEMLFYLKQNLNDESLKQKIISVLKITKGLSTSSPQFKETLDEMRPIVKEIRNKVNQNISLQIAQDIQKREMEQKILEEKKKQQELDKQNQLQKLNRPKVIRPITNQTQQSSLSGSQVAAIAVPSVLIPIAGASGFSYWWFFKRKK